MSNNEVRTKEGALITKITSDIDNIVNEVDLEEFDSDQIDLIMHIINKARKIVSDNLTMLVEVPEGKRMHELKFNTSVCNPDLVYSGDKPYEMRYNDRGFKVGDWVHPRVVDENGTDIEHPLNSMVYEITYVSDFHCEEGYVTFGIKPVYK